MNKFELQIAWRYLRARKREGLISIITFLSVTGIALGVATIIIVMSVFNGFRTDLMSRIIGVNSHVSVYGIGNSIHDYDKWAAELYKNPQIYSVTPTIEGVGIISNPSYQNAAEGIKVRGISFEDFTKNKLLHNKNFEGSAEPNSDGIILGYKLAQKIGAYVGDEVAVVTPQVSSTVLGAIPRKKTFKVVGLFDVGMYEYDRYIAYMPLETAQAMYNFNDSVESLGVMVKDVKTAVDVGKDLQQNLGNNFAVIDWQKQNSTFFGAVEIERNMMFVILTLIVIVASFNIISGMVMLVRDKSGAIAILRTMGATSGSILRIFIIVGSFSGVVGTVAGVALGLLFCENIEYVRQGLEALTGTNLFNPEIYFLSQLPVEVKFEEVANIVVITLLITLAATIFPALRAAKLNPVEILRYE